MVGFDPQPESLSSDQQQAMDRANKPMKMCRFGEELRGSFMGLILLIKRPQRGELTRKGGGMFRSGGFVCSIEDSQSVMNSASCCKVFFEEAGQRKAVGSVSLPAVSGENPG